MLHSFCFKNIIKIIYIIVAFSFIASCSFLNLSRQDRLYHKLSKEDKGNVKYKGHYKIGEDYTIKGKTYKPEAVIRYNKNGVASWYGRKHGFHGKKTANGDIYNKELLTAAHKTLPLPSLVKVKNLQNGKELIVLVNDRGPFAQNREIDMSEKAANLLGFKMQGTAQVNVQYLHKETKEFLAQIGMKKNEGARAKLNSANKKCSINCYIKLVNLRHQRTKTAHF